VEIKVYELVVTALAKNDVSPFTENMRDAAQVLTAETNCFLEIATEVL
jgi:hypothetical protein